MARPKSEDKRTALLQAAVRVIDAQGLGAPTALIAKEAGVANGTLFTYFATKSELLNELYLHLKREMASAALAGLSESEAPRAQLLRVWTNWMRWALAHPASQKSIAQLAASDEIDAATREEGSAAFLKIGGLIEHVRAKGPLREVPGEFAAEITNAIATATMDYMRREPSQAEAHCRSGFEALWRAVGGS